MKVNSLCLFLTACLSANSVVLASSAVSGKHPVMQAVSMSNKDVLELHKAGFSQDIIIAKIKSSLCNFDTSTQALQVLKAAAVPEAVVLAMLQSGPPSASKTLPDRDAEAPSINGTSMVDVTVPDGTQVEIELRKTVSSEEEKEGNVVDFTVIHPVLVEGITVIKQNAAARGHIAKAKKSGRWGHQGKLDWAMNDAVAVDGKRIALRFTKAARGDSSGGTVAIAAVATTILLGPLGLLWGLKKGKPAIIPAGNRYTVFVHGNTIVNGEVPSQSNTLNRPAAPNSAPPTLSADVKGNQTVQVSPKQESGSRPPTIVTLPPFPAGKRKPN